MNSVDKNEPGSFRERLSKIPKMDQGPPVNSWENAAPPVIARPEPVAHTHHAHAATRAPVARPAIGQEPHMGAVSSPDSHPPARSGSDQPPQLPLVDYRRRRRWPWVVLALLAVVSIMIIVPLFRARQVFNNIERVPVAEALSPGATAGTNILLIGTDSRDGITGDTENAGLIIGGGSDPSIDGERTDTIMIPVSYTHLTLPTKRIV